MQIGLTPDGSSSYFLTRLIGRRRVMEMDMTNRLLATPIVTDATLEADLKSLFDQVCAAEAQDRAQARSCVHSRRLRHAPGAGRRMTVRTRAACS